MRHVASQMASLLIRRWKAHLRSPALGTTPPRSIAAVIYARMLGASATDAPIVGAAPEFAVPLSTLAADPQLLMPPALRDGGQAVTACSYHRRLWEGLKADASRLDEKDLIQKVDKLSGYGERLRWPIAESPAALAHFMTPRWQSAMAPEGWRGSNAYSLLGQVFRLGPVASTAAAPGVVRVTALELQDQPSPMVNAINEMLALLETDHLDLIGQPVSIEFRRDDLENRNDAGDVTGTMRDGIVHYQPKMAEGHAVELTAPDTTDPLFEVPSAVLDLLSPDPRQDMPRIDPDETQLGDPKTALFVRRPQRTAIHPNELFGLKTAGDDSWATRYFRVKVRIEQHRYSANRDAAPKTPTFRLLVANFHHQQEIEAVLNCLYDNWSQGALWVTQRAAAGAEPDIVAVALSSLTVLQRWPESRPSTPDAVTDGNYELVIADDADGTLTEALAEAETPNRPGGAVEVDLVMNAEHTYGLFSLIADRRPQTPLPPPPMFIMRTSFVSRVSRSLERIAERYVTTITPSPFVPTAGPATAHLGNATKLRVSLADQADPDGKRIRLTYPSAIANLPTREDIGKDETEERHNWRSPQTLSSYGRDTDPAGPHHTYWLTHLFSQEIKEDSTESENFRYQAYRDAGRLFQFDGYLEHQYSYRIPFKAAADGRDIKFAVSTDLRHPSDLVQRGIVGVNDGSKRNELRHFMSFDHRKEGIERIELHLNKQALRILLDLYLNDLPETEGKPESPVQLRQLYECLVDLVAAFESTDDDDDAASAELVVERWNFNNHGDPDPGPDNADTSYPSISRNMDWVGTGRINLGQLLARQVTDPAHPNAVALQRLKNLTGNTFQNFVANITAELTAPDRYGDNRHFGDDHPWALFEIPFSGLDDLWHWGNGRPDGDLYLETNAVRVGLTLRRADAVIVRDSFGDGFFLSSPPSEEATRNYPDLAPGVFDDAALRRNARVQLDEYFARGDDSALHGKFMWLASRETDKPAPPPAATVDLSQPLPAAQLRRSLFGDAEPYLNFPTGLRRDVGLISQLYFVPHAFRPIRGHPAIGDAATTMAFAGFLLQLLDAIVARRPVEAIELSGTPNPATSHRRWRRALELASATGGVADKLSALIARVDDVAAMASWPDAQQKSFFDGVSGLVERAEGAPGGIRAELRRLFASKPGLFATAKAFGIGIFDPDSFSNRLYSLRIHKLLRGFDTGGGGPASAPHDDTDRFTFADIKEARESGGGVIPYLIDILDDVSYDNEFEIREARIRSDGDSFRIHQQPWQARQVDLNDSGQQLTHRGGGQARLAEDLIEDRNAFITDASEGAAGGPASRTRAIELDVVHYNPEWRIHDADDEFRPLYVLPARRPPLTPKQILPQQGAVISGDDTPFRSTLIAPWDAPPAAGFDDAFVPTLREVIDGKAELDVAPASAASHGIVLKRREQEAMQAFAAPSRVQGWERIESYLSHYYFIVETDEEESGGDVAYSADSLEIDVEVGPTPFESKIPKTEEAKIEERSKLYAWFRYRRLSSQGADNEEPKGAQKPAAVGMDDVLDELDAWLVTPPAGEDHFTRGLHLLRERPIEHDRGLEPSGGMTKAVRTHVMASIDANRQSRWRIKEPQVVGSDDDGIGHVCAVEFFQIYRRDEDGLQTMPDARKYVVRVSVLDEPWQFTRARLRVKRNFRDVDGNNDPDINPMFVQTSPASPWSGYGRQVLTLGPAQFKRFKVPDEVAKLWIIAGDGVPTLSEWCYAELDRPATDFGPLVRRNVLETGIDIDGKTYTYWNRAEAGRGGQHGRPVTGYLEQRWDDAHYMQGTDTVIKRGSIKERGWTYGRQLLTPADGASLELLTRAVTKSDTPGAPMDAVVSWHSRDGDEVMRVTWPVRFMPPYEAAS